MTMCGAFSPLLLMSCATNLIVGHLFSSQGSLSSWLRKTRSKGRSPRTLFMNTFPNWRWFKSQKFRQISSPFWSGCGWLGTKFWQTKKRIFPAGSRASLVTTWWWFTVPVSPCVRLGLCMFTKMTNDFRNFGSQLRVSQMSRVAEIFFECYLFIRNHGYVCFYHSLDGGI